MSDCEVTERVLVRVFDLAASHGPASDIFSVSPPISLSNCCVSQPLSFNEKRSASGMLLCEQFKRCKDEHGKATSQSCARGGQEQTHAAKCSFQSSAGMCGK